MKLEAAICNDEIDEAKEQLKKCKDTEVRSKLKGWIRKKRLELKELGIKGKVPKGFRRKHEKTGDAVAAVLPVLARPARRACGHVLASIDI